MERKGETHLTLECEQRGASWNPAVMTSPQLQSWALEHVHCKSQLTFALAYQEKVRNPSGMVLTMWNICRAAVTGRVSRNPSQGLFPVMPDSSSSSQQIRHYHPPGPFHTLLFLPGRLFLPCPGWDLLLSISNANSPSLVCLRLHSSRQNGYPSPGLLTPSPSHDYCTWRMLVSLLADFSSLNQSLGWIKVSSTATYIYTTSHQNRSAFLLHCRKICHLLTELEIAWKFKNLVAYIEASLTGRWGLMLLLVLRKMSYLIILNKIFYLIIFTQLVGKMIKN